MNQLKGFSPRSQKKIDSNSSWQACLSALNVFISTKTTVECTAHSTCTGMAVRQLAALEFQRFKTYSGQLQWPSIFIVQHTSTCTGKAVLRLVPRTMYLLRKYRDCRCAWVQPYHLMFLITRTSMVTITSGKMT